MLFMFFMVRKTGWTTGWRNRRIHM